MPGLTRMLAATVVVVSASIGCATVPVDQPQPSCSRGTAIQKDLGQMFHKYWVEEAWALPAPADEEPLGLAGIIVYPLRVVVYAFVDVPYAVLVTAVQAPFRPLYVLLSNPRQLEICPPAESPTQQVVEPAPWEPGQSNPGVTGLPEPVEAVLAEVLDAAMERDARVMNVNIEASQCTFDVDPRSIKNVSRFAENLSANPRVIHWRGPWEVGTYRIVVGIDGG